MLNAWHDVSVNSTRVLVNIERLIATSHSIRAEVVLESGTHVVLEHFKCVLRVLDSQCFSTQALCDGEIRHEDVGTTDGDIDVAVLAHVRVVSVGPLGEHPNRMRLESIALVDGFADHPLRALTLFV